MCHTHPVILSAFEPGGLGQLIALRYGTLPIVHATGGLAGPVAVLDADPVAGNGISFDDYTAPALLDAIQRALRWYGDRAGWGRWWGGRWGMIRAGRRVRRRMAICTGGCCGCRRREA